MQNSSNFHLLDWCSKHRVTFTRSRAGNKNDGWHVEQKNWSTVRALVGYHRYDTPAEMLLLNEIWKFQSLLSEKPVYKARDGAKITKSTTLRPPPANAHNAIPICPPPPKPT